MTNEELKQKIQENAGRDFREYAGDKLLYLNILRDMGYTVDQAIHIMLWFNLEEISSVLGTTEVEDIAGSLNALSECIGYLPPNHFQSKGCYFLRIAGTVDTN